MEPTAKKLPSRTLKVTIENNDYEIAYPNTGQYLSMINLRHSLTNNKYAVLVESNSEADQRARFTAEMIAFFIVCCPNLQKDLNTKSFSDLDMLVSKKLLQIYLTTIMPWLTEWEELLSAEDIVEEKKV